MLNGFISHAVADGFPREEADLLMPDWSSSQLDYARWNLREMLSRVGPGLRDHLILDPSRPIGEH